MFILKSLSNLLSNELYQLLASHLIVIRILATKSSTYPPAARVHGLTKPERGDGLVVVDVRRRDGRHHDGLTVAAQSVLQQLRQHGVTEGHADPLRFGGTVSGLL